MGEGRGDAYPKPAQENAGDLMAKLVKQKSGPSKWPTFIYGPILLACLRAEGLHAHHITSFIATQDKGIELY